MLGGSVSGRMESSGDTPASLFGDEIQDKGDRSSAGNRWPRQETMALLKIRSDMDTVFRDSNLKGPLWDDVSRKMAELGFHRSSKKCKEKFENVYKYHKRTKDGRTTKQDGKSYRFFDQLEALDQQPPLQPPSLPPQPISHPPQPAAMTAAMTAAMPAVMNIMSNYTSSSSTSSDEEFDGRSKKKRKWKEFFDSLMKDVIEKQEKLQKKFFEAIEKREQDRELREESWKMQEIARMNREHEIIVQERTMAAAKDAAVISFLQKISEQETPPFTVVAQPHKIQAIIDPDQKKGPPTTLQQPRNALPPPQPPQAPPQLPPHHIKPVKDMQKKENNGGNTAGSPSRWPKAEIEALINIRKNLDLKYEDNGPKGPLWEDISSAMANIGYNRSSKRCKEKWENINKYFKKVKESNKRRPEDSKTCPYFHLLDNLYKEKKRFEPSSSSTPIYNQNSVAPLMVEPEQQWPIQQAKVNNDEEDEGDEYDEDGEDDDEESGNYEIVSNKPANYNTLSNIQQ